MTRTEVSEQHIRLQSLEDKVIQLAEKQAAQIAAGNYSEKLDEEIEKYFLLMMNATRKFTEGSKNVSYHKERTQTM